MSGTNSKTCYYWSSTPCCPPLPSLQESGIETPFLHIQHCTPRMPSLVRECRRPNSRKKPLSTCRFRYHFPNRSTHWRGPIPPSTKNAKRRARSANVGAETLQRASVVAPQSGRSLSRNNGHWRISCRVGRRPSGYRARCEYPCL